MSRFDLHRGSGSIDYYLNVQASFHEHLATRMVIPVIAAQKVKNMTRGLHVPMTIEGVPHYLVTPMMAAVATSQLGKIVGSAQDQSYDITAAIDFLLQGF